MNRSVPAPATFRLSPEVAPLGFETTLSDGRALVTLRGELDLAGARRLEAEVERLARPKGPETVVMDLRGLDFLDSSGLRLVTLADRRMAADGRRLVLVRGPEAVHRVFEITRLADRLNFVDSPDADGEEGGEA
jgi:anti-anti-sigma factor